MGMFDYVNYECVCPVCGEDVTGFQSKSGGCMMDTKEAHEVNNFYSTCEGCDCWLEFTAIDKPFYPAFKRVVTKGYEEDHNRSVIEEHTEIIEVI